MRTTKAKISLRIRSLISAFGVCCLDTCNTIPLVSISKIEIFFLASVAAQVGLSLRWSQTPKTGFLVRKLIGMNTNGTALRSLFSEICSLMLSGIDRRRHEPGLLLRHQQGCRSSQHLECNRQSRVRLLPRPVRHHCLYPNFEEN